MRNRGSIILIVEDSETQALKLQLLCEGEGWEPVCASSVESAMAKIEICVPDVILAGDHLPEMRGGEFRRRIRTDARLVRTPVLLLCDAAQATGGDPDEDDSMPISAPPEALLARIRRSLDGRGPSAAPSGDPDFRGARILAIDDSPTQLEYLAETLRAGGYSVEKATSGAKGLKRLAEGRFDCVLVDLVMPEMDGIEVCRRINRTRHADVDSAATIMLTARENREDMTRGLEAGADDFVGKSQDLTVLNARIQALLRRKFFEREHARVLEELKGKELEALRAMAGKHAAEAKAALSEELAQANQDLKEAHQKLKQTHLQLVQTEKMASLGQLVAGIAHEINNPLAFVLNHLFTVENALARVASELDAQIPESIRGRLEKMRIRLLEMRDGLTRVKELVLSLRTFSRLDEGEIKTIDIHASIDSVLLFLQYKMKGRIELEKQYGFTQPLSCIAGQFNQVIMNLVANAVDAIEGAGKITISTREEGGQVVISVRDTGPGIPEAIRNRIFDPFFTTKPVGQGTGLGLAISYQIVHAHGGRIEARGAAGEGAEFTVSIPLNQDLKANDQETVSRR